MTIYQKKLQELEDRMVAFSVATIRVVGRYSSKPELRSCVDQLIRSSTSIGANYAEANNASSKIDFKNKIFIAKKEAGETRYWLKIFSKLTADQELADLQQEALELNLILQKIISTMKNGNST